MYLNIIMKTTTTKAINLNIIYVFFYIILGNSLIKQQTLYQKL